jgi:hypothetical protein
MYKVSKHFTIIASATKLLIKNISFGIFFSFNASRFPFY